MAFIIIKLMVTGSLCFLNSWRKDATDVLDENHLQPLMHLLLAMHCLSLLFLRKFYNAERHGRVNTSHWWVWIIKIGVYSYAVWKYNDEMSNPESHKRSSSQVWIPIDIMLTIFVSMYYLTHLFSQASEISDEDYEFV